MGLTRRWLFAGMLGGMLALSGCSEKKEEAPVSPEGTPAPAASATPSGNKLVGVALASRNHNFFIGMEQGITDELKAQGLPSEVVIAEDSASTQQQQVDTLVRKGAAAIVMCPVDAQQAITAVEAANRANVPVFCIDRRVTSPNARVACTVETNNVEMGKMAAEYALQLLCEKHKVNPKDPNAVKNLKSHVVHLWGLQAASSAQDRAKGFDQVFNKTATPNVKVTTEVGDFSQTKSQQVMAPVLSANPDIELVFCHNDDNAIGTLNAILDVKKSRGAPGDPNRILIVGIDGNKPAIEEIRKGNIEATVSQEPIKMGQETVRQVKKVLEGSQPDQTYIATPYHLVTQKEANEKKGQLWSDQLRTTR